MGHRTVICKNGDLVNRLGLEEKYRDRLVLLIDFNLGFVGTEVVGDDKLMRHGMGA